MLPDDPLMRKNPKEFETRVKRIGIVNAMDDENFAAAVQATGRKKLIIAGVTNVVAKIMMRHYPHTALKR